MEIAVNFVSSESTGTLQSGFGPAEWGDPLPYQPPIQYTTMAIPQYYPQWAILESDEEYIVMILAPGLKKGAINVTIKNNEIQIKALNPVPELTRQYKTACGSLWSFDLDLNLAMPGSFLDSNASAKYEDGVLSVRLIKGTEKSKKINVE